MKQQVARLSPHQNGKVFAVLAAVGSLVFLVPFFLFFIASAPQDARPPMLALLAMPFFYLIFGYVMVAVSCFVYNLMFKYIGGFEFESTESDA
jgi:heme A synthase